jgi:TetR/AcrR family transcriptional repressor of lmrAB and yxaGH operons
MTAMSSPSNAPGTRERLIQAMSNGLQIGGFHGVALNDLLTQAQAPKGVLYHHFPGGKVDLAVAAIRAFVTHVKTALDGLQATHGDPFQVIGAWLEQAQKALEQGAFERTCPLASVALDSTAEDVVLRQAVARGFAEIREYLESLLEQAGVTGPRASALAILLVSGYEGALIQARVAGSVTPLEETSTLLLEMLRLELTTKVRSK